MNPIKLVRIIKLAAPSTDPIVISDEKRNECISFKVNYGRSVSESESLKVFSLTGCSTSILSSDRSEETLFFEH